MSQAPFHNVVDRWALSLTALRAGRCVPPSRRGVCLKEGTCASECAPDKAGFNHSVGVQEYGLDKRKMTTTPDTVALGEAACGAGLGDECGRRRVGRGGEDGDAVALGAAVCGGQCDGGLGGGRWGRDRA